jgi:hypothetical protein
VSCSDLPSKFVVMDKFGGEKVGRNSQCQPTRPTSRAADDIQRIISRG